MSRGQEKQGQVESQWENMLKDMRKSASDKAIPEWQRKIMESGLDWAQALHRLLTGKPPKASNEPLTAQAAPEPLEQYEQHAVKVNWLLMLALLLAGYLLWRIRYRLGLHVLLGGARLLSRHFPARSMRLSAQAMKWCLHMHGHKKHPYQSVREHWQGAACIAPLARRWLGYAVESYCAMRFGNVPATSQQAANMRKAVGGACEILMGTAPELSK